MCSLNLKPNRFVWANNRVNRHDLNIIYVHLRCASARIRLQTRVYSYIRAMIVLCVLGSHLWWSIVRVFCARHATFRHQIYLKNRTLMPRMVSCFVPDCRRRMASQNWTIVEWDDSGKLHQRQQPLATQQPNVSRKNKSNESLKFNSIKMEIVRGDLRRRRRANHITSICLTARINAVLGTLSTSQTVAKWGKTTKKHTHFAQYSQTIKNYSSILCSIAPFPNQQCGRRNGNCRTMYSPTIHIYTHTNTDDGGELWCARVCVCVCLRNSQGAASRPIIERIALYCIAQIFWPLLSMVRRARTPKEGSFRIKIDLNGEHMFNCQRL